MLLVQQLKEKLAKALNQQWPELDLSPHQVEVNPTQNEKFGHYQCNQAMKLAKELGMNPRDIATTLSKQLEEDPIFEKIEVAGPGFINMHLRPSFLSQQLAAFNLERRHPEHPQTVLVDFSSPNIAKEMHVGHLRSTIIGDCLARVLAFMGNKVLRINHIGDWGTQFGMLITYLRKHCKKELESSEPLSLSFLMSAYRSSKKCFDEDADFKKESQQAVVSLQSGEEEARKIWELICEVSRRAYQEIYDLLGVEIEEKGESFYNPYLKEVVEDLSSKGLLTLSDGAKCFFLDGEKMPLIVQKSDGGYNYATTDLATIRYRVQEQKAERILYVTDNGQALHFKLVFAAARKAGYVPDSVSTEHVPFGLVLGSSGKKFKTRSGETEALMDLIQAAIDKARQIIDERGGDLNEQERQRLAKVVGIAAIKYADLSTHRNSDYTFSYERMLQFEGNTAPFMLYSYVRTRSIERKMQALGKSLESGEMVLEHPSELALALHLLRFDEALEQVSGDLAPNRLADYLYQLAVKFNAFFRDCRVEGSESEASRRRLTQVCSQTLGKGLELLGLELVEKM